MGRKVAVGVGERKDSLNYRSKVTREMSWRLEIRTEVWAQDMDLELAGDWMTSEGPRRGSPGCTWRAVREIICTVLHIGRNVYFEKCVFLKIE